MPSLDLMLVKKSTGNYPNNWKQIANEIKQNANYHCQVCGKDFNDLNNRLQQYSVHHLNGEKNDNRADNLIAVCAKCHLSLERNRIYDEYYQKHYGKRYALL